MLQVMTQLSTAAMTHSTRLMNNQKAAPYDVLMDPLIEIVVPVLNEEHVLDDSITTLHTYMSDHLPYRFAITIADNGSTDETRRIADELSKRLDNVHVVSLTERGRGRALKKVWRSSRADIVSYMDVDLSTGLESFIPMITPLVTGDAGIAIGSRLHKTSKTTRGLKRDTISRIYNRIIRVSVGTKFRDAQCGFKAMRTDVARTLLPRVKDDEWFFDTELLIKAENAGVLIHEQPVVWVEDADSRVNIVKTAIDDLKGLMRVRRELDGRGVVERLTLPALLIITGIAYWFGALHNGMANSYYAAAVQAASQNWTAWLFGSLDAASYVSVDKPPLATMVMGLSARIFGFSSLSMLLPSILAGVGSVWLIYAAVRRQFGYTSAWIAGVVLAVTPVAALMCGFNNPDAILTLLLAASGYSFLRSLEQRRPLLWLGLATFFTGLAFNTKMLQGLMVIPAMVVTYLAFAKPPIVTRILHMVYAGVITAISTLWWSVLVWMTPASSRPWVGSTTDNNIWSLIFGYNGFGRLFGNGSGGGGPGGGGVPTGGGQNFAQQVAGGASMNNGGMRGGPSGSGFGGETSILRMWNTDFGPNIGWLLLPALIGGGMMLWILRRTPRDNRGRAAVVFWLMWLLTHIIIFSMTSGTIHPYYVVVLAPAVAALIGISVPFLWTAYRRRSQLAWTVPAIVLATTIVSTILLTYSSAYVIYAWIVGATGLAGACVLAGNLWLPSRTLRRLGATLAVVACMMGPTVYTLTTLTTSHTGSIPTAGLSGTAMTGSNNENAVADSSLITYLLSHQDGTTWIVAVASANQSAAIQLTSGQPVMAVGGFNGSDTPLTLDQFKALIKEGKLKYYAISSSGRGGGMGGNSDIETWVKENGTIVNYGGSGMTLYELSI